MGCVKGSTRIFFPLDMSIQLIYGDNMDCWNSFNLHHLIILDWKGVVV